MAEVAEKPQELDKEQLEKNIKVADIWRQAVRRGEFSGGDCQAVGGLLKFLDDQYDLQLAEYDAAMVKNPNWGRPSDMPPAGGKA